MTVTRPVRGPGAAPARGRLRVLLVEDDPDDAELVERELRDAGFDVAVHRVVTEDEFLEALGEPFEVVLADLHLPRFDGLRALALVKERAVDVPFVIVSGTIGEDVAVDAMRCGAADYLLKDRLARLAPAIDRVVYEHDLRVAKERAEEERRRADDRFRSLVENSWDAVVVTGLSGFITYASPAIERIIGRDPDELLGRNVFEFVHPEDQGYVRDDVASVVSNTRRPFVSESVDRRVVHRDGTVRWVRGATASLIDDPAVGGIVFNIRDVTDLHDYEEQLEHQALHDALTGLANRALFRDRLGHALEHASHGGPATAVIVLDLDRFHATNQMLGHQAGDRMLSEASARLVGALRSGDTVARVGEDEFAVLVEDLRDESEVLAIACHYKEAMRWTFSHEDREVHVSASCGIAVSEGDDIDADGMLRDANSAVEQSRGTAGDRCEVFDPRLRAELEEQVGLEHELRRAFERGDLRLDYQPVVSVADGRVVAFEALLRWEHERRGLVPAGEFLGVLEGSGLIGPVGEWVVGEACRQLAAWSGPEMGHVYVSANLSARQIGPELPRLVADALDATGIDPSRLWLELTETAFMADLQVSERVLHEVRDLGVHLVVDDFGTGYSSLAYLKRFPVEVVKIDQVFVRGLGLDRDDTAIVAAVIGVAHALGLRAVAEGVETEEQLAALRALDCDFAQGYYFARPQPALEAMRASASWRADPGA